MIKGQRSGRTRRLAAGLLTGLLACAFVSTGLVTLLFTTGTAHAEAYRFWGYWQFKDGSWAFAQKGPASITPSDGEVEGWRYAISGENAGQRTPRATVTFEEICGTTPAADGRKRVGVVVDFGLPAEAPGDTAPPPARGECAVVDIQATSAQVLTAVASVRQEDGLFCGVDGYPATGCGEAVADEPTVPSPEPAVDLRLPTDEGTGDTGSRATEDSGEPQTDGTSAAGNAEEESGSSLWPAAAVVAAIVVIGLGAFVQYRRRGDQNAQG